VLEIRCTIVNILQRRNHCETQDALYFKKISFEVCPIPEWSEKRNPTEDNLPKNNSCASFRLKKNIYLVGQLGRKGLTTEKPSTPPLKKSNGLSLVK